MELQEDVGRRGVAAVCSDCAERTRRGIMIQITVEDLRKMMKRGERRAGDMVKRNEVASMSDKQRDFKDSYLCKQIPILRSPLKSHV